MSLIKRRSFIKNNHGLAAVEFALIAPLLILLFLGTVETSYAISVDRKVSRTASAVADLVTQSSELDVSDIKSFMTIANKIMAPYDMVPCIVVSSIRIQAGQALIVDSVDNSSGVTPAPTSQCTNSGNPNDVARTTRTTGTPYPVPDAIKIDGTVLVAAEVQMDHSPIVGFFGYNDNGVSKDTTAIELGDQILLRPRIGNDITFNP